MVLFSNFKNFRYVQYASALSASLIISCRTVGFAWISPAVALLLSGKSPVGNPNTEEVSWISCGLQLGNIPSYLFAGFILSKLGNHRTLLWFTLPMGLPWIVIALSKSITLIFLMEITMGAIGAIILTSYTLYISEISDEDIRGRMSTLSNIVSSLVNMYILSIGPFMDYTTLTLSCCSISMIAFVCFLFTPVSPYHLVREGNMEKAMKSLQRLSAKNVSKKDLEIKISSICTYLNSNSEKKTKWWALFTESRHRRSFIAGFVLRSLQTFCGATAVTAYLMVIVGKTNSSISPQLTSMLAGLFQFPAMISLAFLIDKLGRKPLLLISSTGCVLTLLSSTVYLYLMELNVDTSSCSWIPAISLLLYSIFICLGVQTLPLIFLGELFDPDVRYMAINILNLYSTSSNGLLLKFFLPLCELWGLITLFLFFIAMTCCGAILVYFVVPETKNKTLADIQAKMSRKKHNVESHESCHI